MAPAAGAAPERGLPTTGVLDHHVPPSPVPGSSAPALSYPSEPLTLLIFYL